MEEMQAKLDVSQIIFTSVRRLLCNIMQASEDRSRVVIDQLRLIDATVEFNWIPAHYNTKRKENIVLQKIEVSEELEELPHGLF